jgi:uncharacterized protein
MEKIEITACSDKPSIKNAKLLFIITVTLIIFIGSSIQHFNFWIGLALTEIVLILIPTIIFIVKGKLSPKSVLRLNYPGINALLLGLLFGLLVWPLGLWIQINLINLFSSKNYDILIIVSEIKTSNLLNRFLVLGVLASICEETLFRGYIFSAFENKLGVKYSILWITLLFSCYHLVPTTIIATLPLSFLLCWICWRFNSIFPAIILHFTNNFLSPFLFVKSGINSKIIFNPIILISCGILIGFIMLMFKTKKIMPANT